MVLIQKDVYWTRMTERDLRIGCITVRSVAGSLNQVKWHN